MAESSRRTCGQRMKNEGEGWFTLIAACPKQKDGTVTRKKGFETKTKKSPITGREGGGALPEEESP